VFVTCERLKTHLEQLLLTTTKKTFTEATGHELVAAMTRCALQQLLEATFLFVEKRRLFFPRQPLSEKALFFHGHYLDESAFFSTDIILTKSAFFVHRQYLF